LILQSESIKIFINPKDLIGDYKIFKCVLLGLMPWSSSSASIIDNAQVEAAVIGVIRRGNPAGYRTPRPRGSDLTVITKPYGGSHELIYFDRRLHI